jgi:hypothetical protein
MRASITPHDANGPVRCVTVIGPLHPY